MTSTTSSATPSIYIHRAHPECCDPDIFKTTFEKALGSDGCVRAIDLVQKTDQNGIPFVRAFIHFKFWPEGDVANRMRRELMTDERLTITSTTRLTGSGASVALNSPLVTTRLLPGLSASPRRTTTILLQCLRLSSPMLYYRTPPLGLPSITLDTRRRPSVGCLTSPLG